MNVLIYKRPSKRNRRINNLSLRIISDNNGSRTSKYKALKLYEYKHPRNALERKHNIDVEIKCKREIYKAELKLLEEP